MLPFPRLIEYGNNAEHPILDIDFGTAALGSTDIIDKSGHVFTRSGTGTAFVTNDASKGHVMTFASGVAYSTPMVQDLRLSSVHFRMRIVFKSTVSLENMLFSTGDYFSAGAIVGGMLFTINNSAGGTQLFCTTSGGVFTRCLIPYTVNTWRDLSIEWEPGTKTMIIYDNDTSTEIFNGLVPGGFGDGTQLCIGASYVRGTSTASFQGSIQKMKIELVQ